MPVISESDYVLVTTLRREHGLDMRDARRTIARADVDIAALVTMVERLSSELTNERGKRKLAEYKLARRH